MSINAVRPEAIELPPTQSIDLTDLIQRLLPE